MKPEASRLNVTAIVVAGLAGTVAGVPAAAVAYAVPEQGPIQLEGRWWAGAPAPLLARIAVAVVAGACCALAASRAPSLIISPAFGLVAVVGTALAVIDIRRQRLPHMLTGLLLAVSAVSFAVDAVIHNNPVALLRASISAAAVLTLFLVLALAFPGQLGLGDIGLAGLLSLILAWLGPRVLVTGLVTGLTIQAIIGIVVIAFRRKTGYPIAMGPALFVGWLVALAIDP
jgi:leader peptidase (prepilin peptidase) / N-methyltransferase